MDSVGLDAAGDAAVVNDQRRGARRLDHRNQRLRMLLEDTIVHPVLRHDHRGDVAAPECVAKDPSNVLA
ncbi:hypothetical protein D3C87_2007120 [compost metagenome]